MVADSIAYVLVDAKETHLCIDPAKLDDAARAHLETVATLHPYTAMADLVRKQWEGGRGRGSVLLTTAGFVTARSPLRQVKAAGAGDGAKVWLDPTSCNHAIYMVRAAGCPPGCPPPSPLQLCHHATLLCLRVCVLGWEQQVPKDKILQKDTPIALAKVRTCVHVVSLCDCSSLHLTTRFLCLPLCRLSRMMSRLKASGRCAAFGMVLVDSATAGCADIVSMLLCCPVYQANIRDGAALVNFFAW